MHFGMGHHNFQLTVLSSSTFQKKIDKQLERLRGIKKKIYAISKEMHNFDLALIQSTAFFHY
jgi:hypothetical protein